MCPLYEEHLIYKNIFRSLRVLSTRINDQLNEFILHGLMKQ